jgi:hypothetical protein
MSYDYSIQRAYLFTEQGQVNFLKVRDQVKYLLTKAGAFRFDAIESAGDSWTTIACVDRLVELKEIVELPRNCWQQYRVFTSPESDNR